MRYLLIALAAWIAIAIGNQLTKPATQLGLTNGKLVPCPDSPNCVCSCEPKLDEHYVAPIRYTGTMTKAMADAKRGLQQLPGIAIVEAKDDYLRATATSRLMRFVDDVEVAIDEDAKEIHFRSASRIGRSDLGVNRARFEIFRDNFSRLQQLRNGE